MKSVPTQMSDVIYNATEQKFEATVTFHEPDGAIRYACALDAPISMDFDTAAKGLMRLARKQHAAGEGLFSILTRNIPASRLSGRNRPGRKPLPLWQIGRRAA